MTVTVPQKYELARQRWKDHKSPEILAEQFGISREHASRIANDLKFVPEEFQEELRRRRSKRQESPRAVVQTDGAGHIAAPEKDTASA